MGRPSAVVNGSEQTMNKPRVSASDDLADTIDYGSLLTMTERTTDVITSYSIHYTKLYDLRQCRRDRRGESRDRRVAARCGMDGA